MTMTYDSGFTDWGGDDDYEGGPIKGDLVKFTDGVWGNRKLGLVIEPTRELIVVSYAHFLQKWGPDRKSLREETRELAPGEKIDLKALNDSVPRKEWIKTFDGKSTEGPYKKPTFVYLVDERTGEAFSFVTDTAGGGRCVRELKDKVRLTQRLRGADVLPVVTCSTKPMNTQYGIKQARHFVIKEYKVLGGGGGAPALTSKPQLSLQEPAAEPSTSRKGKNTDLNDDIDDLIKY